MPYNTRISSLTMSVLSWLMRSLSHVTSDEVFLSHLSCMIFFFQNLHRWLFHFHASLFVVSFLLRIGFLFLLGFVIMLVIVFSLYWRNTWRKSKLSITSCYGNGLSILLISTLRIPFLIFIFRSYEFPYGNVQDVDFHVVYARKIIQMTNILINIYFNR